MTKDKLRHLLDKYAKGICTVEERQLLELWFEQQETKDQDSLSTSDKQVLWQQIEARTANNPGKYRFRSSYYRWSAAAAILLAVVAISGYFLIQRQDMHAHSSQYVHTAILPGENKAVLTLSDGRQIELTENNLETTQDQGISIIKTTNGLLQYRIDPSRSVGNGYNTITTPRGGQYEIILPDGSQVTLNAESSLRFAVAMNQQHQRIVELDGEGYFTVAKDTERPFIVKSKEQEIQVLGTVFNVNTYHNERSLTTLLEGSVLINRKQKLLPGQQAQVEGNKIHIREVDVLESIDWKNNIFIFRNESLASIMERVGRWYDVDYTFEDIHARDITFNGEISRYAKVEDILNLLKVTSKTRFDIKGRSITIR
ncbi:FecR family protein [Sphingobacterium faecale]|uniref:FecR family protein n=1 Tax=Sphingobacterium faecale TaxID=2803775 RepID=A0ABS1QYT8_9SPHI|nr:FecR family protein [Sphingobacterium faecale]MBL1407245.1 FecR family protein [Sphingobacterium faecale]